MNQASRLFNYHQLGSDPADISEIQRFTPTHRKGAGLTRYLKEHALHDEQEDLTRTYLVYDTRADMLAAYFSLKAGLVSTNERRIFSIRSFDTTPGVELANFAVNGAYRDAYAASRGCGKAIFTGPVMDVIRNASEHIGIKLIYLYALPYPSVIKNYESYGFRRLPRRQERRLHNRLKPRYDSSCVFMSMSL